MVSCMGVKSDCDHCNDDHDNHTHQADNDTNDDGHHLIVLGILLFQFCLRNLFYWFIECLHQEVQWVTTAVLVLTPNIHLVGCSRLEFPHLESWPSTLQGLDMSSCHIINLQNEEISRVTWQGITRYLKRIFFWKRSVIIFYYFEQTIQSGVFYLCNNLLVNYLHCTENCILSNLDLWNLLARCNKNKYVVSLKKGFCTQFCNWFTGITLHFLLLKVMLHRRNYTLTLCSLIGFLFLYVAHSSSIKFAFKAFFILKWYMIWIELWKLSLRIFFDLPQAKLVHSNSYIIFILSISYFV